MGSSLECTKGRTPMKHCRISESKQVEKKSDAPKTEKRLMNADQEEIDESCRWGQLGSGMWGCKVKSRDLQPPPPYEITWRVFKCWCLASSKQIII